MDRYFELEELMGVQAKLLKPSCLRCDSPEKAEDAAEKVRESWKLGNNPIANVVELLEECHIKVQQVEVDKDFDGCSGWGSAGEERFPVIVLANWLNADLARKRFTAAHELGHLVMDLSGLDDKATERACHRFAGAFLLPRAALFAQLGRHRKHIEWKELAVLKQEYGISMGASLHRLHDLDMISDAVNKTMSIARSCKGWKTSEPYAFAGSEECFRFRQLLYRGVAEEKFSLSKAAELAGKPVEALQDELSTGCGEKA
jgi:Zn-dependent peptidase ImmA (M78 family)